MGPGGLVVAFLLFDTMLCLYDGFKRAGILKVYLVN